METNSGCVVHQCLKKWGFRRSEDFCWIKTNIKKPSRSAKTLENRAIFQRTKGTVRRSVDGDFIHANVDIDLNHLRGAGRTAAWRSQRKCSHIIEHFCLGRRKAPSLWPGPPPSAPGWMTVGPEPPHQLPTSVRTHTPATLTRLLRTTSLALLIGLRPLRPKSPAPHWSELWRRPGIPWRPWGAQGPLILPPVASHRSLSCHKAVDPLDKSLEGPASLPPTGSENSAKNEFHREIYGEKSNSREYVNPPADGGNGKSGRCARRRHVRHGGCFVI
ncbi:METTL14 [Cordylochernes scorpioides]|uniref:N(6)-adenosine-methyltransferase non-catalytic subunit METTL14 n=1 Tax=Cordylochernes scorpioides TaxID=51811 RepID=A0ABY6K0P0_9ARAC|nr:METTL14 [Cordylochernes scorpioides]